MDQVFEWDEAKRLRVLSGRGIDFIEARHLFDGRPLFTLQSRRGAEERWLSVGELEGRLLAVVWTRREDRIRIVTVRRARDGEKRKYRALYVQ